MRASAEQLRCSTRTMDARKSDTRKRRRNPITVVQDQTLLTFTGRIEITQPRGAPLFVDGAKITVRCEAKGLLKFISVEIGTTPVPISSVSQSSLIKAYLKHRSEFELAGP